MASEESIKLIALTGCRRGEITGIRWSEVNFQARCLALSDAKTGQSIRPLGAPALELLKEIAKHASGEFVFPSIRNGNAPYGGLPNAWRRVASKAGLKGVTLHGLRHAFGSLADQMELTLPTIAALLGHSGSAIAALRGISISQITLDYIHKSCPELFAAADKISEKIVVMMST